MRITADQIEWWTAELRASDRADVKLFYLTRVAPDSNRQSASEATSNPLGLGAVRCGTSDTIDADDSGQVLSSSHAEHSRDSAGPPSATWSLSQLLWAARIISCDERTLWEYIGTRFRNVFHQRIDGWNEQLAVKLVHYFVDTFAADDSEMPRLSVQLAAYAAHAIAPQSAQLTACEDLQTKLDTLSSAHNDTASTRAVKIVVPASETSSANSAQTAMIEGILRETAATVVPMEQGNDHSEGCLACKCPVPAFGTLLRVPRAIMFFRDTVLLHCPLARAMHSQPALFDSILSNEEALLVLSFIFEARVLGPALSHWSLLLSGCPASYPTVPAFWDFTDLAALEGTDVLDDVVNKKTELQSFHEQVVSALPVMFDALQREQAKYAPHVLDCLAKLSLESFADVFSYEAMLWARATFDSRAFKLNIDGDVRLSLVPIADMINHDNRSDVLVRRVEADGGAFVMQVGAAITDASVQSRRELWMSYGPLQNWELLQFYGFVLASNEHDKLPFPFSVPEPPELAAESGSVTDMSADARLEDMETEAERLAWWQRRRQRLIDRYNLFMVDRCWVRYSGVPCEALLALLRVHLAQADEFEHMESYTPFCPLSPATETSVVDTVRETVEYVLALFSTTLEEDVNELDELKALTQPTAKTVQRAAAKGEGCSEKERIEHDDRGEDEDEEEEEPHAWSNYILALRLRLELKHIAQRTLEWCSAQDTV